MVLGTSTEASVNPFYVIQVLYAKATARKLEIITKNSKIEISV